MPESLFSASWYRVAQLRPKLRGHARIHRHVYRKQPWYVLEDVVNQKVHRFTPATHRVIGLMDGTRSVQALWEIATDTLGDDAPTQDEMIRLLAQLHSADVLQSDVPPDTAELLDRFEKKEKQEWQQKLLSPFALRVPFLDPDRFLKRVAPLMRPIMNWFGVALWLAVVVPAVVLMVIHWTDLTEGVLDRVFTAQNVALIWVLFPVTKVLHELGHGLLTRYYGGEVHDMGVMLLVFTPIPYVDASSASAFRAKHERMLVSGGGMIVEVFLAAVAFFVWLSVEAGAVRTVAYNTMLISGLTTLTFNANPLLRFDGYYILADWLEIPNLRKRANDYVGYLAEHYLLGNLEVERPEATDAERYWLVSFAIAAFLYRVFIVAVIMLYILDVSLVVGTILAAISAVGWIGRPLVNGVKFLFTNQRLKTVRTRAVAVSAALLAVPLLVIFLLPVPFRIQTEGVTWVPDEALVRAQTAGFIDRIVAEPDSPVSPGDPLIVFRDSDLDASVAALEARLRGIRARERQARPESPVRVAILGDQRRSTEKRLARARERRQDLVIHARRSGVFIISNPQDLPGRYVEQGELLAHVLEIDRVRVRALVTQENIELFRDRLEGIEVRRAVDLDQVLPGRLIRLVPGASGDLPHPALGTQGGGEVPIDPRDQRGMSAISSLFQIDVEAALPFDAQTVGGHVYVCFDHGREPLANRWYRSLRQLFLSRLDV